MSINVAVRGGARRIAAARGAMITLTPAAVNRVRELCSTETQVQGVRVGVKSRGCSGLSYIMDYVREKDDTKTDTPVKQDGVTVFVSNKAELHLLGSEMDYVDTDLRSEFVFTNPRAKGVCGCGESFHT